MKTKLLVVGPILTRSGYGEQSRYALRALRSMEDAFDIYVQPLQWGQTGWVPEYDEEKMWIDHLIEKTIAHSQQNGTYDASLQITIPNEWKKEWFISFYELEEEWIVGGYLGIGVDG